MTPTPHTLDIAIVGVLMAIILMAIATLLTFPIWPSAIKSDRFISRYWPVSIGGILFFMGTLLLLMSHCHLLHVMVWLINLFIALLFLPWSLALPLALGGMALALLFFTYPIGSPLSAEALEATPLQLVYGALIVVSFLIALFKAKKAHEGLVRETKRLTREIGQLHQERLTFMQQRAAFFAVFQQSGAEKLVDMVRVMRNLKSKIMELDAPSTMVADVSNLERKLTNMAFHLDRIAQRLAHQMVLSPTTTSPQDLIAKVEERLLEKGVSTTAIQCENLSQQQEIVCDDEKITTLLVNSILLAQRTLGQRNEVVLLALEDTKLRYEMPQTWVDYGKEIPALRLTITTEKTLPALEKRYSSQVYEINAPMMAKESADMLLIDNQRIADAHYGCKHVAKGEGGCVFSYVIPTMLRQVRGEEMDQPSMQLGPKLPRTGEQYLGAKALEHAFLEDVKKKSKAPLVTILKAVEMIEVHHGDAKSKSGVPCYLHAIEVAHLLLDYDDNADTLVAALLHDLVRKTPLSFEQIELLFKEEVAQLVAGTTGVETGAHVFNKVTLSSDESIYKLCYLRDKGMLRIKLAESVVNLRTIAHESPEDQYQIAKRNLSFYVPLANPTWCCVPAAF
jgi:hypothetical protein